MHRKLIALVALAALSGCSAATPVEPTPTASLTSTAVPDGGEALRDLGFRNAPAGLSIPRGSAITERIDSANNATVILTSPDPLSVLSYLRSALPAAGFTITGDGQNSLLFEGGGWQGAFTVSSGYSALTVRTDHA